MLKAILIKAEQAGQVEQLKTRRAGLHGDASTGFSD